MSRKVTQYRIFIASPAGLDEIRTAFREVLQGYNETDALERGVLFSPVGWEETLGSARRAQSLINDDLRKCDALVLVLWDRWGTPPDQGSKTFTSGSEEELKIATQCLEDPANQLSDIVVFFRAVDPRHLADPGKQLSMVLAFRRNLEKSKSHLFTVFDQPKEFRHRLRMHLAGWLRAHEKGIPLGPGGAPDNLESGLAPKASRDSENPALQKAWRLASEGRLTEAETAFAKVTANGDDVDAFNQFGKFLVQVRRLAQAEVVFERVLELGERAGEKWKAKAYCNLGLVYQTRGELESAGEVFRKALEIEQRLGSREGMAAACSNLGLVYRRQGELERGEEMVRAALKIDEELGSREGIASDYSNLGLIFLLRGDLEGSEEMFRTALEIVERLPSREDIAIQYSNLGLVYGAQGYLKRAEEMLRRALEIDEQIGSSEGMASTYGNLGLIYRTQGELARAEVMFCKALEIAELLASSEGMARYYSGLGSIYEEQRELARAEEMHRRALAIDEQIGSSEGMAGDYSNLGSIYEMRGDPRRALEYWIRANELRSHEGALTSRPSGTRSSTILGMLKLSGSSVRA